jgi:hypothetical protein
MTNNMENIRPCPCCGQPRLVPTEPGEWEYCEFIRAEKPIWVRVSIKLPEFDDKYGQDGLRIWQDGKMVWWPSHCAWRKVE